MAPWRMASTMVAGRNARPDFLFSGLTLTHGRDDGQPHLILALEEGVVLAGRVFVVCEVRVMSRSAAPLVMPSTWRTEGTFVTEFHSFGRTTSPVRLAFCQTLMR